MTGAPEPFRLRVQKALSDCLLKITPGNGFRNDVTGAVFRGRDLFGESDPETMLSILEPPVPPDPADMPQNSTVGYSDWDLIIQGFVPDDLENPTDPAHYLMAEVKQVLIRERQKTDQILVDNTDSRDITSQGVSLVINMFVGQGVVRPPDEGVSDKAYFVLRLTLRIVEDLNDPFA